MLSITTLLFPACPDLLPEEITREGQILFLTVRSSKKAMACPDCAQESTKVHSRYPRTLADVSLMDYEVRLRGRYVDFCALILRALAPPLPSRLPISLWLMPVAPIDKRAGFVLS